MEGGEPGGGRAVRSLLRQNGSPLGEHGRDGCQELVPIQLAEPENSSALRSEPVRVA